jgi:basic membrane lipoprotein Med (substrate-binding protein (PBP1-ABC) superfamily)
MKALTLGMVAASLAVLLTGCTGGASNTESTNTAPSTTAGSGTSPTAKVLKVAMVFDSGGKGDKHLPAWSEHRKNLASRFEP